MKKIGPKSLAERVLGDDPGIMSYVLYIAFIGAFFSIRLECAKSGIVLFAPMLISGFCLVVSGNKTTIFNTYFQISKLLLACYIPFVLMVLVEWAITEPSKQYIMHGIRFLLIYAAGILVFAVIEFLLFNKHYDIEKKEQEAYDKKRNQL